MQKLTVSGDIGCYTLGALPPLNAMDTCIDMGASITALLGMEKAYEKAGKKLKGVAVIGDSTFFHSGITGLVDIIYTKGKSTVIILDNSITAMTGHQDNAGSGKNLMGEEAPRIDIVKLVKEGLGIKHTYEIDAYDVKAIKKVIKREVNCEEPSVLVIRRPCVLLFRGIRWSPMKVDTEACTFCKLCIKLGCPAISSRDEKGYITPERCIGCTVCAQVCPVNAIKFVDEEGMHIHDIGLEESRKSGGKQ
jgi:indolepyruvate ferredoxin oxidoreductase alpha subunit